MEIRVQRTVTVHPKHVRDFTDAALDLADHSERVIGVGVDVFLNSYSTGDNAEFRIFSDFQSMAQYEQVFLEKLLLDPKYHDFAEKTVHMITDEPADEMFVRLKPDDYFMNRTTKTRPTFKFETATRNPQARPRYRREREYLATKGKLREVMQLNFAFMDDMFKATNMVPDFFCSRFARPRIGGAKISLDFDDCPMCSQAFLEQDHQISTQHAGVLTTKPVDVLLTRLNKADVKFQLSAQPAAAP